MIYHKKYKKIALHENNFLYLENCKKTIRRDKFIEKPVQIALRLFSAFHRVTVKKNGKNAGGGQAVVISTLRKSVKILDYNRRIVYSFFKEKGQMNVVLEGRKTWETVVARERVSSKLLAVNQDEGFFSEEFIPKIDYRHEDGFHFLLNDTTRIFKGTTNKSIKYSAPPAEIERVETYLRSFPSNSGTPELLEQFKVFLSRGAYKKCICHGDAYYNNILFDGQNYYYIDFESVGEHFFLFDVVFYLLFESYRFSNNTLMSNYLLGKYDWELETIFKLNNAEYDCKFRKLYLFIVMFEYYGTRIPKFIIENFLL